MEEAEVPLENLQEHVHHSAERSGEAWVSWVALSTAILAVLDAKISLTNAPNESDRAKAERYEKEQEEIKSEAEHKQTEAKTDFRRHEVFARGVAMFQIAIAIAAVSALTKKRRFWIVSLLFGAVGCIFLALGAMPR